MANAIILPMQRPAILLLLAMTCLLSSCRYNYVPLIPAETELSLPVRTGNVSLERKGNTLELKFSLSGNFDGGYLKVSWFDGTTLLQEDSIYLDQDMSEASLSLVAPRISSYRAIISLEGNILRQVELYEKPL